MHPQGSTIGPLVRVMGIKTKQAEEGPEQITSQVQEELIDNIMAGIETITGKQGHFRMMGLFKQFEKKYIQVRVQQH